MEKDFLEKYGLIVKECKGRHEITIPEDWQVPENIPQSDRTALQALYNESQRRKNNPMSIKYKHRLHEELKSI